MLDSQAATPSSKRRHRAAACLAALLMVIGGSACAQILGLGNYTDCCEPIGIGRAPQCVYCGGTGGSAGGGGAPSTSVTSTTTSGGGAPPDDAHCHDARVDADETDRDCGGAVCEPCDDGKKCKKDGDCSSKSCPAGSCLAPTCSDEVANAKETDVDCGGPSCPTCDNGKLCLAAKDCASGACTKGRCRPWATEVAVGDEHACAVRADGQLSCWGANNYGQLGNGTTVGSNVPVIVKTIQQVKHVTAGGFHTCAIDGNDQAWCWGYNVAGMLGNGGVSNSPVPVRVSGIGAVKAVSTSLTHTCAVTTSGAAMCWGSNSRGALGNGTSAASSSVPVAVVGLSSGIAGISAGTNFGCAVLASGAAKCWGQNDRGQLGNNSVTDTTSPVTVTNLSSAKALACGYSHVCALTMSGGIRCWGANQEDQLADGTVTDRHAPVAPDSRLASGFIAVASSVSGACALGAQGDLYCWGDLGGSGTDTVEELEGFSPAPAQVGAGGGNICVVDANGRVLCRGGNNDGELGDGTYTTSSSFVLVAEN